MNLTENIPSENEFPWQLNQGELDARTGPSIEEGPELKNSPQWFRYNNQMGGETEQEKSEKQICIQKQLDMGILRKKVAPNIQSPIEEDVKKKFVNFTNLLKQDPKSLIPDVKDTFKPMVVDKNGNKRKLGPNDKCPCGSGKKFKKCHGIGKF